MAISDGGWTVITKPETIYAPEYSRERLEQEDAERHVGIATHRYKYNKILATASKYEKRQVVSFILFLCCFPEAALWGWIPSLHVPLAFIGIILQAIFSCVALCKSGAQLESLSGEIE